MKKVLKALGIILIVVILAVVGFVGFLTVKEYNPDTVEKVAVENNKEKADFSGDTVKVLSFNTGYGCLGDNADFFMDGGENVMSTDEERMKENMANIEKLIAEKGADFSFLQEVDTDSKRTYGVNQVEQYITNSALNGSFALNYSCPYVPYPMPPIGKVNSGILTLGKYNITGAQRVSLPVPFKWPVSTANLKRCLLVSRAPIEGSDKELVLVNLHLEAYDDGEGKIAQTKMLLNILEEEYKKGNYVIAGGDFNQTFTGGNEKYPMVKEGNWMPSVLENDILPEGWKFSYDLNTPSCRLLDAPYDAGTAQHYAIDGFILSPNVEQVKVETLNMGFKFSDHNPVFLEAKLK